MTTSCHFPLHRAPGDPWAALCSCEFGYGISIREGRRELEVKEERKGGSTEQNRGGGSSRGGCGEQQKKEGREGEKEGEERERETVTAEKCPVLCIWQSPHFSYVKPSPPE